MDWIFISLKWYFWLFFLGLIFTPITKRVFRRFSSDFCYPFAKVLGLILSSYAVFVLGILKIAPFTRVVLFSVIGIFALINYFIAKKEPIDKKQKEWLNMAVIEEVLFLAAFFFWTWIRSQEPSLHSLEKFMDFGFINSILKSNHFPPKDIWYTPLSINYYYFGHLTGALLIKLTNTLPAIGYNLILSTLFAMGITQVFSFCANIIALYKSKIRQLTMIIFGLLGAVIVNLGGNLHTIYLFTHGYPNESPVPFWKILSLYNPSRYWYPNATRFIPFTIHEFPSYSYVVADLHGHVFDIPFVLLTLAILFQFFIFRKEYLSKKSLISQISKLKSQNFNSKLKILISPLFQIFELTTNHQSLITIFLGFMAAVHYMTNAFDGPIYILLYLSVFLFIHRKTVDYLFSVIILIFSFIFFSLPFSAHFTPFVNGIGVNCAPNFLVKINHLGPFIFEKGNCQHSPLWMLFILWGFFWLNALMLVLIYRNQEKTNAVQKSIIHFLLLSFGFGLFLTIIPEFFYIKDIYPAHFRANTMFKLGYQAFIIMGIASILTFFLIKLKRGIRYFLMTIVWLFFAFFVVIYPLYSIPSYYGMLDQKPQLDGSLWLKNTYPEDKEIVDFLNRKEARSQPVILEAQGDSYTDYERISSFTGLPTVAGWWVHEWLWRGSSNIVGDRIPDVQNLYESKDLSLTKDLLKKYGIKYVVISRLERQKYPNLDESKFAKIGKLIFKSGNGFGALYQVNTQ